MEKKEQKEREGYSVKELRVLLGLPPIKKGAMNCLKCERTFYSSDKKNRRICKKCFREHNSTGIHYAPIRICKKML